MNGYMLNQISANADRPQQLIDTSARRSRNDRRGSDSGSDHNHDTTYSRGSDSPEDVNRSLTSQALNADGSPKRPMNAFMIFARRRRPQVSAENQMMRTGEISKLLSKEWTTMSMAEKQFYLDQAKRLKDTFNSKYPDYVYRRRPNNSRKKRRGSDSNPSDRLSESSRTGDDHGHDSLEPDESSPVDMPDSPSQSLSLSDAQSFEDSGLHGHLYSYNRHLSHSSDSEHAVSPIGHESSLSATSHSSSTSYSSYNDRFFDDFNGIIPHQPVHLSHVTNVTAPSRLTNVQFSWSEEHGTMSGPLSAPPVSSGQHISDSITHPTSTQYTTTTTHEQEQPMHSLWPIGVNGNIDHSVRSGAASSWPMPPSLASVTGLTGRQRSLTTTVGGGPYQSKIELFSPNLPPRAWSNTPSASSASSATSMSPSAPSSIRGSSFQTLTAPFYPLTSNRHVVDNETLSSLPQPRNSELSSVGRQESNGNYGYGSFSSLPPLLAPTPSTAHFTTHDTGSIGGGSQYFSSSQPTTRHSSSQPLSSSQYHMLHDFSTSSTNSRPQVTSHHSYWDRLKSEGH